MRQDRTPDSVHGWASLPCTYSTHAGRHQRGSLRALKYISYMIQAMLTHTISASVLVKRLPRGRTLSYTLSHMDQTWIGTVSLQNLWYRRVKVQYEANLRHNRLGRRWVTQGLACTCECFGWGPEVVEASERGPRLYRSSLAPARRACSCASVLDRLVNTQRVKMPSSAATGSTCSAPVPQIIAPKA